MNWETIAIIVSLITGLIGTIIKLFNDYSTLKHDVKDLTERIDDLEKSFNVNEQTLNNIDRKMIEILVKLDLIMKKFSMEIVE